MPPRDAFTSDGMRLTGLAPAGWLPFGTLLPPPGIMAASGPSIDVLPGISPDLSNYDWPTFDPDCFKSAGVARSMIGTQNAAMARDMVAGLQGVGIPVPWTYCFHYYGNNTQPQRVTETSIRIASDGGVPVVTLDAEADDPQWSLAGSTSRSAIEQRNAQLRECVRMVREAGLLPMCYTAPWWYVPMHGNTTEFSDMPLHLAAYGANDCALSPIRAVNFGGWSYCVIHQYCSTGGFCGRDSRDRNHVWSDAPGLNSGGWTVDQETRLQYVEALVAGNGPTVITATPENLAILSDMLGIVPALGSVTTFTGQQSVEYYARLGVNLKVSVDRLNMAIHDHEDTPHTGPDGLAPHMHEPGAVIPG